MTLTWGADPALAQGFRLGTWSGALESVNDFSKQETTTKSERTVFETQRMDDRLTLRNSGAYIYDPGLVTLSLGGTLGLSREHFDTTTSGSGDRQAVLRGYDTLADVLSEQPLSLNLFANRNESVETRELAGQSEILSENRGARLSARRLYIPSTLSFRQERQDDESRTGDIVSRRENRRNVLTYEGQRGWVDSEMDARYEYIDETDVLLPELSYRSHEASLNYSLDFGSELDWHWDSRLRYFARQGVTEQATSTVDELLRIDHTPRLRGDYRYSLVYAATPSASTTTQRGAANLRHQLYESLTTTAGADATRQTLEAGERDTYGSRLDLRYTKRVPGDGRLNAGVGGSVQYQDERFEAAESAVPQESHTATAPVALPIPLANASVVAASIVVTKTALGPLPVGCLPPPAPPIPLVLGIDYAVQTSGDITEIVPIPCAGATPGINPGDTIAVDYRFRVAPSRTLMSRSVRADISLDYRWIRSYFIHEQTDQSLLSGRDSQSLDNPRSDTVGLELRYDGQRIRAGALGEARRYDSLRLTYDSVRSSQFMTFVFRPELSLNLAGDEALFKYKDPERETQTVSGHATLTYVFDSRLFADLSAGVRRLRDTLLPTEQAVDVTLRARWLIRDLEVAPTVEFHDLQRGDTETKMYRAVLNVTRRF